MVDGIQFYQNEGSFLIFCGTGFLESNFAKYLLNQNFKVIVYKNKRIGYSANTKSDNLIFIEIYDKNLRDL